MNVLHLSHNCCIRVIKETLALRACDEVGMHHMQIEVANKDCLPALDQCSFYRDQHQLKYRLKLLKDIDLIHCHNEPDWTVEVAKDARPDLPLIFDTHDLVSTRDIRPEGQMEMEQSAVSLADAYIFPSQGYQTHARKFHSIPDSKPSAVIYSYCNVEMIMGGQLPRQRGIAYEGFATVSDDALWSYRDHRYLVEYCTVQNIPITFFGLEHKEAAQIYRGLGAMVYGELPYLTMLDNLSRYDWCFVGNSEPTKTLQHSMPNKLFESIAAGVPVIVCNSKEAGEFAEAHGVGVSINSIHEIPEIYDRHAELRKNVQQKRHEFIMESQVETILGLYRKVLNV